MAYPGQKPQLITAEGEAQLVKNRMISDQDKQKMTRLEGDHLFADRVIAL